MNGKTKIELIFYQNGIKKQERKNKARRWRIVAFIFAVKRKRKTKAHK